MSESVYQASLRALQCAEINEKQQLTEAALAQFNDGEPGLDDDSPAQSVPVPGRPPKPFLVPPQELTQRKLSTDEGRGAFVHALAHIEFNAINLALDAAYRFRGLPADYYQQWLSVAAEEAFHFRLLQQRLTDLGYSYGDFPAHNGLWDMAVRTEGDVLQRMALVPRVFEARGLDVTPGMIDRLLQVGDEKTADTLKTIYADEIGHVEIGNRWFHFACEQKNLNPQETFLRLIKEHFPGQLRSKFNYEARIKAGFTRQELDHLKENI